VAQNFPNPVRGARTTIAYGVPQAAGTVVRTTLRFYDVRGRVVRSLVDGLVPPGRYQVSWDGKDDRGAAVAPGVYFYEYVAGATRVMKKALFLGP
jgi:flagellar hook assembly protein FlgD